MKILVTCPPMLAQMEALRPEFERRGWQFTAPTVLQTLSVEALCALVPEHDGWIIGDDPANAQVVEAGAAGSLKAAIKWGIGTDNVDFEAFGKANIPVTNTPGMFDDEVADIALGYLIGLARQTFEIHESVKRGEWPKPAGTSLAGKTLALVGYGDIGAAFARRALACGLKLNVYDPRFPPGTDQTSAGLKFLAWPQQLEACDFVCFTCALTKSSFHMLNAETIQACKAGVRVINVARGPLIDEPALAEALRTGHVDSVALDVFEDEPLPMTSALRDNPRNIFGSHNASNTHEAVMRTSLRAMSLLENAL
jgi:D-3-phosphoglycerate dehydrogenase